MQKLIRWISPFTAFLCLGFSATANADFVRIEEDHIAIRYEGDWRTVSGAGISGGTVKVASAADARVHVYFRGPSISLIGYRCHCAIGTAEISVDGQRRVVAQAIPSSSTPEAQSVISTIAGLGDGPHVLTIEVSGEDGQGGTANASFVVDAFDIEDGAPLRRLEESDAAIMYSGAWMDIDDPSVSGGSVLATQEVGATATLSFSGNSFQWIGYGCPCTGGIADAIIDGQSSGPLSNLSTTRQAQLTGFSTTTLPDGEHEMTLRVTGANTDAPPWVVVDAFAIDATTSDTTAPSVTMTAPANNASLTGVVTLEASAQDNVGVAKVQFFGLRSGGRTYLLGEDYSAPFTLAQDTSGIPSGSDVRIWARAFDAANNYADSAMIAAIVNHSGDNTPPVVTITEPPADSTVSGTINLTATASDDQQVDSVRFVVDVLSPDYVMTMPITQPPYTMQLDTQRVKDGLHRIEARASDVAGNVSDAQIMITVDNSVQPNSVRVDDTHPAIAYNGGSWTRESDGDLPRFHWDGATWSSTVGATLTGTFQGTGLRWHGFICDYCGVASVSIDGGTAQTVDTFSMNVPPEVHVGTVVYNSPTLASGKHTITITVQASPPNRTRPERIYIDAFEVLR
ncbi:MAG: Ig-like domain-containing protein [Gammaproteobacteria bacterium]